MGHRGSVLASAFVTLTALTGCGGGGDDAPPPVTIAATAPGAGGDASAMSASSCAMTVTTNSPVECKLSTSLTGPVTWTFTTAAPEGMIVQPKSGEIRWTPTASQTGSFAVNATVSNGSQSQNRSFTVTVGAGAADPAGLYVAPSGADSNAGTATSPFRTLRKAVQTVNPGQTIFVRGGEYRNAEYGQPYGARTEASLVRITRDGTAAQPIVLRPFGNEYARLLSDVSGIAMSGADYWTIQGFEIMGNAQSLNFNIAMDNWWNDEISPLSGRGLPASGSDHLVLRDLIVHDFPGVGLANNDAEFVNVENNIVYNNAWWSTGGVHGISLSDLKTTSPANAAQQTIVMTGNMAFGNQSLIISHVFSKGFVKLEVDEGNGLHMQNNRSTFQGRALVENNLAMWNGKSGLGFNTFDRATVRRNGFYLNARIVNTGELSLQSTSAETIENNLFHPRGNRITIKDFQQAFANVAANATLSGIAADAGKYASILRLAAVFADPANGDFARASGVPSAMGVDSATRQMWKNRLAEYGIVPAEPTQVFDAAYMQLMKTHIFANWPANYSQITLEDNETGHSYTYAQRCHFPGPPTTTPC